LDFKRKYNFELENANELERKKVKRY